MERGGHCVAVAPKIVKIEFRKICLLTNQVKNMISFPMSYLNKMEDKKMWRTQALHRFLFPGQMFLSIAHVQFSSAEGVQSGVSSRAPRHPTGPGSDRLDQWTKGPMDQKCQKIIPACDPKQ